ncbi:hypothetical protein Droror1_Dr00024549 [Drosera rotundifolia]
MRLRFRLSKLYSAKGLSLKADALRSRAALVDVDDDLVSSSSYLVVDDSFGGRGSLDDEDAEARVSGDVDRPRNGAAGDSEGVDGCPQCKKKCTLKDVRRMYGSRVVVIDEQSNKRIRFLEAKCDAFEKKIAAVIGVESRGVLQFGSSKELSMEGTRGFLLL